jgi:foldase protein PrsA
MKKITKKASTPVITESACCQKPCFCCKYLPIIAVILVILAGYAFYRYGIVATVNGKPITRLAYWQNLEKLDKKQTIKQMANEALVYQEAAKKNITVTQAEIDTEIASVEAQIKAQGQTLDAALAAEGLTKADLIKQVKIQKMVEKLANPVVNITQAEIDAYLTQNKSLLPTTYTKEQLQALAKTQLANDAKNTAIDAWFAALQKASTIVIR